MERAPKTQSKSKLTDSYYNISRSFIQSLQRDLRKKEVSTRMKLTKTIGKEILLGSWFLGGGGGGLPEGGEAVLEQVLQTGEVVFRDVAELADDEVIVTASLVGSPASTTSCIKDVHYRQVYDWFCLNNQKPLSAVVTNEPGGHSVTNGWMLSAITGLPCWTPPATAVPTPQASWAPWASMPFPITGACRRAAGGDGPREIGITATGTVDGTSQMVRMAAVQAGGYVTVLRNPVTAAYFRENASVGVVSQARMIGQHWQQSMGDLPTLLQTLKALLNCTLLGEGRIRAIDLQMSGGFDVGTFTLETAGAPLEAHRYERIHDGPAGGRPTGDLPRSDRRD